MLRARFLTIGRRIDRAKRPFYLKKGGFYENNMDAAEAAEGIYAKV